MTVPISEPKKTKSTGVEAEAIEVKQEEHEQKKNNKDNEEEEEEEEDDEDIEHYVRALRIGLCA